MEIGSKNAKEGIISNNQMFNNLAPYMFTLSARVQDDTKIAQKNVIRKVSYFDGCHS